MAVVQRGAADPAVRPLTAALLEHAGDGDGRRAVDLGCGSGVETRALVAAGWRVTAIDSDSSMPARLSDLVASGSVEAVVSDIRDAQLPSAALVHSSLALPFVPVADFGPVWERIRRCLVPGGWLAVDLFGSRDDWRGTPDLNFHPRAGVDQLVAGAGRSRGHRGRARRSGLSCRDQALARLSRAGTHA